MATVKTAWDQVSGNIFKTWLIMFLFSAFTVGVVYVLAQGFGYGNPPAGGGGLGLVGMALILAGINRKSTRLNSSHSDRSRMPSSA